MAHYNMMASNKNGDVAFEIDRTLVVTNKTAWFVIRIREAMKRGELIGRMSGVVVAYVTFIGGKRKNQHG